MLSEVCFDCVLVLGFVMGCMLQFGETAHTRVHYYHCSFPLLLLFQAFTVLHGVHANELTVEIRSDNAILGMSPMLIITIAGNILACLC